jgi:putative hemolysin
VTWAKHQDEVRAAQRLRYGVFAGEMGARLPLPVEQLDASLDVEPPALIKGYLRLGAKVLGPPAWDPDFNSADLPMMMRIADLPSRYRKHFLGA